MHDKNGKPLAKGDRVTVECTVRDGYETEGGGYCNVQLETVEFMYPSQNKTAITLNSRQVVKIDDDVKAVEGGSDNG